MRTAFRKSWGDCAYSSMILTMIVAAGLLTFPSGASAQQTWHVQVGAESKSQALQADAFLPNEIWIYAGDSIEFTFPDKNEIHTATLLQPGQSGQPGQPRPLFAGPPMPPPAVGCNTIDSEAAAQPNNSSYDGDGTNAPNLACVNSGPLSNGASYTINFPMPGNYKLVCLVHADMNGVIHVLSSDPSSPFYAASLPYDQSDYDRQARDEARALLNDTDISRDLLMDKDHGHAEHRDSRHSDNVVLMTGDLKATPGGRQYLSIVRFLPGIIKIHAGETVEWVNADPTEPHTVTFGAEPANPATVVNAIPGPDGALEATINSPTDSVSSGFLQAAPQDRVGLAQSSPGITRLRIKFTKPGIYPYICGLHDVDGMVGKVIVLPFK
jgi:plastocyanin